MDGDLSHNVILANKRENLIVTLIIFFKIMHGIIYLHFVIYPRTALPKSP